MFRDDLQTQSYVGTGQYKSPQVFRGDDYTNKTDIWSVGVLILELLDNQSPSLNAAAFGPDDKFHLEVPENLKAIRDCVCSKMIVYSEQRRCSLDEIIQDIAFRDHFPVVQDKANVWQYEQALKEMEEQHLYRELDNLKELLRNSGQNIPQFANIESKTEILLSQPTTGLTGSGQESTTDSQPSVATTDHDDQPEKTTIDDGGSFQQTRTSELDTVLAWRDNAHERLALTSFSSDYTGSSYSSICSGETLPFEPSQDSIGTDVNFSLCLFYTDYIFFFILA